MRRLYIILFALVLATVACSKNKKSVGGGDITPTGTVPPPPTGGTPTPPVYGSGATADFTIVSKSVFDTYTGRVSNNPSNFKINVDLTDYNSGSTPAAFGGTVKISYSEINSSGQTLYYQGQFVSGNTANEAKYNHNVVSGASTTFKAFFEDVMGGLILVVDQVDDLGLWNGKIFYKNFTCGRNSWDPPCNPYKPTRCWFISIGPYNCQAFLNGSGNIDTASRLYPEGYTKLGSFQSMDSNKALNK